MKWAGDKDGIGAETPVGTFWVLRYRYDGTDSYEASWCPFWVARADLLIGRYRTAGAAKGACKRYAKRMAAAFKAMGKAGWQ